MDNTKKITVYGKNAVYETLKNKAVKWECLCIKKGINKKAVENILSAASLKKVKINELSEKEFLSLAGGNNAQGVIGIVIRGKGKDIARLYQSPPGKIIMLDSITDPSNFGSIIRSAEHFGFKDIIIQKDNSAPLTPAVYKVSSGAVNFINIYSCVNLTKEIKKLKDNGYWIYGIDINGKEELSEIKFDKKSVIVIGSEGSGIRRLVKESCDFLVRIKKEGNIDSLNAGVAAGVVMYKCLADNK